MNCKRRDCPVCGKQRRRRIAGRVAHGIRVLGDAAWFVGTWDYDVTKKEAVKVQQNFLRYLRRYTGINIQYAATWEVTERGRLHLNLILAPWTYMTQQHLSRKWNELGGGPIVWIEKVTANIATEVTKLGNYMAKFEQQVTTGRGICYSRDWPKLPTNPRTRLGTVYWTWLSEDHDDAEIFQDELDRGIWKEFLPGEYSLCGEPEFCDCFQFPLEATHSHARGP